MGTRFEVLPTQPKRQDHPHAYGDKKGMRLFCLVYLGSSPRVWGQAFYNVVFFGCNRIIPTRMGTSYYGKCKKDVYGDHPHAYGDKFTTLRLVPFLSGSSPRVWGQENEYRCVTDKVRIIPTRMGTSETSPNVFECQ